FLDVRRDLGRLLAERALPVFDLRDLAVGVADLGHLVVVRARLLAALRFALEVGVFRPRLLLDALVLLAEKMRVRVVRLVLLVLLLDHLHVVRRRLLGRPGLVGLGLLGFLLGFGLGLGDRLWLGLLLLQIRDRLTGIRRQLDALGREVFLAQLSLV